ncbi:MAG: alpha/beta hydrolase [Pseudomonadota bacterium]
MERQEIAALLRELLDSILVLERVAKVVSHDSRLPALQSAARALIDCHESLAAACYSQLLHYKTRTKLLRVVDQAASLVALCQLLEQAIQHDQVDPQLLQIELATMSSNLLPLLEPVVEYYDRKQQLNWSVSEGHQRVAFDDAQQSSAFFSRSIKFGDSEVVPEDDGMQLYVTHDLVQDPLIPRAKIGPTEVPVYFGTTRSINGKLRSGSVVDFFDGRGSGELTLGRALISIPPGHRVGKLELPLSIWKFRLKPNPEKHVVLRSTEPLGVEDWLSAIREELFDLPKRMAFVFIHGFNVTFSQAMMRAGQIARDIGYEGLVTSFSWGSEGTVDGYPADEDTVQLAGPKLVEFLAKLHTDAGVETFHIVAHSMGCRALLSALKETSWWSGPETPVAEAVFAAPDVDATQYQESMMAISRNAGRYTLYGSERDWAIAVSRCIRKNHPRAGDGGENILVMNGVETVDATEVGEQLFGLGHSYIADKRTILGDLWAVLRGLPMPRFGLQERLHHVGKYWALVP